MLQAICAVREVDDISNGEVQLATRGIVDSIKYFSLVEKNKFVSFQLQKVYFTQPFFFAITITVSYLATSNGFSESQ